MPRGVRNRGHEIAFIGVDRSPGQQSQGRHQNALCPADVAFRSSSPTIVRRPLTETDAVDIWIARWLKIAAAGPVRHMRATRAGSAEIWEEARSGRPRQGLGAFPARYPFLLDRVDFGPHRRIARRRTPTSSSCSEGAPSFRPQLEGTVQNI
jgi:hypothetical protein